MEKPLKMCLFILLTEHRFLLGGHCSLIVWKVDGPPYTYIDDGYQG